MHQILTNLYIGDIQDAQQARGQIRPGLVVNCSKDIPFFDPTAMTIRIPVDDDGQVHSMEKMYSHIHATCAAIHISLQRNQAVFVHCFAGRQRSACVVCAYLMLYQNMPKEAAMQYIKSKRKVAFFPSANFDPVLTTIQGSRSN
jgi:protein-tyrosine phosphatase